MDQQFEQNVKSVMADILNIPENAITESTSVDNTEGWDSANHIQLVVALEQEFSVSFDVNEIESMLSYQDILDTIQFKL